MHRWGRRGESKVFRQQQKVAKVDLAVIVEVALFKTLVGLLPGAGSTEIEFDNIAERAFSQFPDGSFGAQEFDIETAAGIGPPVFNAHAFNGLEYVGSTLYGTATDAAHTPVTMDDLPPLQP